MSRKFLDIEEHAAINVDKVVESEGDVLYNGNAKSAEYYHERMKTLDRTKYRKKNYAEGTIKLMQSCEDEFSKEVLQQEDWKQTMLELDCETVESFLDFHLR
ncbi:hypothetical protein F5B21DRAFT_499053 [Xylaria acuta]|nr:hypothetical protein F5B21DRAFT_499053 [Xylaria acuta]